MIRKFAELSNETAGEHFTPREVIRLMVNLLFIEDDDVLTKPGVVRTIYDPAAGTGGMLSVAGEHLADLNPKARLTMFGQELNDESYAICKADMLIKGQDVANIATGNTLSDDGHPPQEIRLHALQSAVRHGVEEGREGGSQGARDERLQWPLRTGSAKGLGWLPPFLDAPHLEDAADQGRWQSLRHRCSTAHLSSRAARAAARAKSAATCWRTWLFCTEFC
jgi:hypothetical protein